MAASSHNPRRRALAAMLLAGLLGGGAAAAQHDAQAPINLEAASSDFDYRNNTLVFRRVKITQGELQVESDEAKATGLEFVNSQWTLTGNVRITVPDGKLASDTATVSFRDNQIVRAGIVGRPASFEQRLKDGGQLAQGHAEAIEYDVRNGTVQLEGDAWLSDGQSEIRGRRLVYDIAQQRVAANPGETEPGGVKITILPRKQPDAPAQAPPAEPPPAAAPPPADVSPEAPALILYTSGSTGRPRGVVQTFGNVEANSRSIVDYLGLSSADRALLVLPLYYCYGRSVLQTHLLAGGSLFLDSRFAFPRTVLEGFEREGCTGFAGVPSTYQTLLRNSSFPRRQFPALRKLQQAGGKLQPVLIQELVNSVPQAQVFVMYGQTEATARLSYLPPADLATKLGSIGKGIPGVTLRVIGEDGAPIQPTAVGEIYAWGDNISPGYWNNPEASAEKFFDGVLHTGDLATVDEDGYIFVVDRKADFIKSYGYRVSSQRVEECIVEISEVVAAAVIGEPDDVRGEAIWAFVVRRTGSEIGAEAIINYCGSHLANYMVPKEVVFLDRLPMNAHGKIVKNELRRLAAETIEAQRAASNQ
jgi:lipopolysaccharide transport protein LptA